MSVVLQADGASARIRLTGAEPVSWVAGGRERLWQGDPAWWDRSAPLLFPVVGASRQGVVSVAGRLYPMPQHGFAKDAAFSIVAQTGDRVRLRLTDDAASRAIYPFAFRLDVWVMLRAGCLAFAYEVFNPGPSVLPYAIGFHPGFAWPSGEGEIVFERPEERDIPRISPGGLLARRTRRVPLDGCRLPLSTALFDQGALVFLNARSNGVTLRSASGDGIGLTGAGFRHLAVWSKPDAPFIALESWSGHADWEDAVGELDLRDGMTLLRPGQSQKYEINCSIINRYY